MPDLSTKAKAQEYLGLDMDKLNQDKQNWLEKVLPIHLKKGEERQNKLPEPKRIR